MSFICTKPTWKTLQRLATDAGVSTMGEFLQFVKAYYSTKHS